MVRAVEILARIAEKQLKSAHVLPPPIDVPIVLFNEHIMFVIGKTQRAAVIAELGPGYAFPAKGWESYAMHEGTTRCLLSALVSRRRTGRRRLLRCAGQSRTRIARAQFWRVPLRAGPDHDRQRHAPVGRALRCGPGGPRSSNVFARLRSPLPGRRRVRARHRRPRAAARALRSRRVLAAVFSAGAVPPSGTDVCALADVEVDGAIVVTLGRGSEQMELIVVRDAAGVRGFRNVCAHLPLPLNIDARIYSHENHVHCDHHYAVFRFSDGRCTAGECVGESLTPVALAVEGDRVRIAERTK